MVFLVLLALTGHAKVRVVLGLAGSGDHLSGELVLLAALSSVSVLKQTAEFALCSDRGILWLRIKELVLPFF